MKYKILNLRTGELMDEQWIVTQAGKVANWSESQGWDVQEEQADYSILEVKE